MTTDLKTTDEFHVARLYLTVRNTTVHQTITKLKPADLRSR